MIEFDYLCLPHIQSHKRLSLRSKFIFKPIYVYKYYKIQQKKTASSIIKTSWITTNPYKHVQVHCTLHIITYAIMYTQTHANYK